MENTFYLTKKIYLTPGYRYEYISTNTEGYYNKYVVNNANDTLLTINSPSNFTSNRDIHLFGTGLTYNLAKNGKWIANLSKNFRSVNFSDINIVVPSLRVDPNIEDEKGYTADITTVKIGRKKLF